VVRVLDSHGGLRRGREPINGQGALASTGPAYSCSRYRPIPPFPPDLQGRSNRADGAGNIHTASVTVTVAPSHPYRIIDKAKRPPTTIRLGLCQQRTSVKQRPIRALAQQPRSNSAVSSHANPHAPARPR
jgi:hypothetical protein